MSRPSEIVFSYLVPVHVHVHVKGGIVTKVVVIDETPIRDPRLVEGDGPLSLSVAVQIAQRSQDWPAWTFGY